MKFGFEDFS